MHNDKVPINHALLQGSKERLRASPQSVGLIAGWDPSGGAGMLADAATVQALHRRSLGIVTTLTAQSLQHWSAAHAVASTVLQQQLEALALDPLPQCWKVGALGSADNSAELAQWLIQHQSRAQVVLDPVLRSSSQGLLGAADWLRSWLPLRPLLCPNSAEWAQLQAQLPELESCPRLLSDAPGGALLLRPGQPTIHYEFERRPGEWRGTGCTLSTLISVGQSAGLGMADACAWALAQLQSWLEHSPPPHIHRHVG